MNNIMVVHHLQGLFIYLDFGYPSSYHDVIILHQSELHKGISFLCMMMGTWNPCLGDLGYLNKEMFIMRKIRRYEVSLKVNHDVINA